MRSNLCLSCLAVLIATGPGRADVTISNSAEVNISPLLPPSMADPIKKQLASQIPGNSIWRMKGDKVSMLVDGSLGIIDYGKNTITLIDSANRQYITAPLAGFTALAVKEQTQQVEAAKVPGDGMTSSASIRKTGERLVVRDIQTEETLLSMNVDAPNSPNFPGGLKLEMRFWLAAASEVQRIPALRELSAFSTRTKGPANALELVEQLLAPFPGVGVTLRAPMKKILESSGPPLQTQIRFYSPMLKQLTDLVLLTGQKLPPGADPSGPLGEITVTLTGISNESIPDSVFEIPDGYKALTFSGSADASRPIPAAPPK